MKIVEKKINELIPYENNPRRNDKTVEPLMESIKQYGFLVPLVVDKNNVIIAGHTRYKAAKKLNMKTVPTVVADDLSEEETKAFRIIDNKVAEETSWDFEKLNKEIKKFSEETIETYNLSDLVTEYEDLTDYFIPSEPKEKIPQKREYICPFCGKTFYI